MPARSDADGPETTAVVSLDDERLDDFRHLAETDRRQRIEAEQGLYLAEGARVVGQLLAAGRRPRALLVTTPRLPGLDVPPDLSAPVYVVAPEVLNGVAGYNLHRGVIASFDRPTRPALDDVLDLGLLLVVEAVNDHENLGSLYRNAAAFGVGGVVVDERTCDHLYRRVVRVSIGHSALLPTARVADLPAALVRLRHAGCTVLALSPGADADLDDVVHRLPTASRCAVVVGAEGPGLSKAALAAADVAVRIPMARAVDSLNVATAAAVALHAVAGRRA